MVQMDNNLPYFINFITELQQVLNNSFEERWGVIFTMKELPFS